MPANGLIGSVLMSGTIQERKGIAFFNHCAESLQTGGYRLSWAGQAYDPGERLRDSAGKLPRASERRATAALCVLGHLSAAELQRRLLTDILSSARTRSRWRRSRPTCTAASCCYLAAPGWWTCWKDRSAVHIYESHSPGGGLPTRPRSTARTVLPTSAGDRLAISRKLGLRAFLERMNGAIAVAVSAAIEGRPPVAVIAHLYYTDLGFELCSPPAGRCRSLAATSMA